MIIKRHRFITTAAICIGLLSPTSPAFADEYSFSQDDVEILAYDVNYLLECENTKVDLGCPKEWDTYDGMAFSVKEMYYDIYYSWLTIFFMDYPSVKNILGEYLSVHTDTGKVCKFSKLAFADASDNYTMQGWEAYFVACGLFINERPNENWRLMSLDGSEEKMSKCEAISDMFCNKSVDLIGATYDFLHPRLYKKASITVSKGRLTVKALPEFSRVYYQKKVGKKWVTVNKSADNIWLYKDFQGGWSQKIPSSLKGKKTYYRIMVKSVANKTYYSNSFKGL